VVLELGTRFGGSTLYFADVMRTVHRSGTPYKILTVDIDRASVDGQVFEVGTARGMYAWQWCGGWWVCMHDSGVAGDSLTGTAARRNHDGMAGDGRRHTSRF
jgi:hypothetical protein